MKVTQKSRQPVRLSTLKQSEGKDPNGGEEQGHEGDPEEEAIHDACDELPLVDKRVLQFTRVARGLQLVIHVLHSGDELLVRLVLVPLAAGSVEVVDGLDQANRGPAALRKQSRWFVEQGERYTRSRRPKFNSIERGHHVADGLPLRARQHARPEASPESNSVQTVQKSFE